MANKTTLERATGYLGFKTAVGSVTGMAKSAPKAATNAFKAGRAASNLGFGVGSSLRIGKAAGKATLLAGGVKGAVKGAIKGATVLAKEGGQAVYEMTAARKAALAKAVEASSAARKGKKIVKAASNATSLRSGARNAVIAGRNASRFNNRRSK